MCGCGVVQFALGLTCFVMHRIIIAVKYGYMSSRQYRRIMSSAGVKGLHKNKNEQLLTGEECAVDWSGRGVIEVWLCISMVVP